MYNTVLEVLHPLYKFCQAWISSEQYLIASAEFSTIDATVDKGFIFMFSQDKDAVVIESCICMLGRGIGMIIRYHI